MARKNTPTDEARKLADSVLSEAARIAAVALESGDAPLATELLSSAKYFSRSIARELRSPLAGRSTDS